MGHYTRMSIEVMLAGSSPPEAVDYLRSAGDHSVAYPSALPDDPFFTTSEHEDVFRGNRAITDDPAPHWSFARDGDGYVLSIHAAFKNYAHEIERFCRWISPFVVNEPGTKVGEMLSHDNEYSADLVIGPEGGIEEIPTRYRGLIFADDEPATLSP